jgi:hypothetical protein
MNKIIFFTYFLLIPLSISSMRQGTFKYKIIKPQKTLSALTSDLHEIIEKRLKNPRHHSMKDWEDIKHADPRIKNSVLRGISYSDYAQYTTWVDFLVRMGADPNICPILPLSVALHHHDINFARLLLEYKADPNHISQATPVDICHHQENGSHALVNTFDDLPAFYFAKDIYSAELCHAYGADPRIAFHKTGEKPRYGNILTHIIEHAHYPAELIAVYLMVGTGAYCSSHASKGGSTLHHIIHTFLESTDNNSAQRLFECASYLLKAEPNLINAQDSYNKTPGYYLDKYAHDSENEGSAHDFERLFASVSTHKKVRERE